MDTNHYIPGIDQRHCLPLQRIRRGLCVVNDVIDEPIINSSWNTKYGACVTLSGFNNVDLKQHSGIM
jgi:hypothetical protein